MMISLNICAVLFFISVTIEVHSLQSVKTFRCKDGKYISDDLFCSNNSSHEEDIRPLDSGFSSFLNVVKDRPSRPARPLPRVNIGCEDESHNSYGCNGEICGYGKFTCSNGTCLNITAHCNTIKECPDGSDELNCGDEVEVGNCSLADGKFLCFDKLRCLDLEYTCDSVCNCFDCSDENENCTAQYSEEFDECPQYFETPNGPKCFCDPNRPEMNKLCKEVEPCKFVGSCSQKCFQYKNKVTCSCYSNYSLDSSTYLGPICKNKVHYENLLVYATSNQLKVVNFTSKDYTFIKKNVQIGAVVGAGDHLYYTTYDDSDRKSIYKSSITTGMTSGVIQSNSSIVSIGVDYITNNIYFTTNTSLSVCSNDGKICTQLKCCNVRHVALAPKLRWMFYMKKAEFQDEKFIMKSAMDGSNEEYFVDGGFLYFSILAVDESTRKLYWVQREENEIWSLSYDDRGYKEFSQLKVIKYHSTLVGFAVFDDEMFFTKLRDNEIYKLRNIERYSSVLKSSNEMYPYSSGFPFHIMSGGPALTFSSDPFQSPVAMSSYGSPFRAKRGVLSTDDHYFSYYSYTPRISLESYAVFNYDDGNATRIIDTNVTFAIKNVYAFNPLMQSFNQNPCAKASCNGLCLLRAASKNNTSNYVCICQNPTSTSDQNLCHGNNFFQPNDPVVNQYSTENRKNDADFLQGRSENRSTIILTGVLVIVALLLVVAMYLILKKRSWSEYSSTLRNWRLHKSQDNVNICDQVEL